MNIYPKCPHCGKKPFDPAKEAQCVLHKPLFMVIPPEGVHLDCPVHPEGHHVFGSPVTWMSTPKWEYKGEPIRTTLDSTYRPVDLDSSQNHNVDYDSSRPWRTSGDIF